MAIGLGFKVPTIATAGVRIVPDLTGFNKALGGSLLGVGGISGGAGGILSKGLGVAAAGAGLAALGGAAVSTAKRASDAFVPFEQSLTKITTLVGVSSDQVDKWGDQILELAPKVGVGPQELADALFFITSAGLRGSEAMDTLEAASRASALGLGDTASIADAVTSAMNAYGSEVLSASDATDVLIKTVEQGKLETDSLANSIGRVIPIASEAGVEFDEVGAAVAALSRTGLNAEEATTALRQLFNNIINPSAGARSALASVGLEAGSLRDIMGERGLLPVLELISDRFGGNTDALFQLIPNIRAVTGFLSLMGANADSTREIFGELNNSVGVGVERFKELENTQAFRRAQAQAGIDALFIGSGSESAENFTRILEQMPVLLGEIIPPLAALGAELAGLLATGFELKDALSFGTDLPSDFDILITGISLAGDYLEILKDIALTAVGREDLTTSGRGPDPYPRGLADELQGQRYADRARAAAAANADLALSLEDIADNLPEGDVKDYAEELEAAKNRTRDLWVIAQREGVFAKVDPETISGAQAYAEALAKALENQEGLTEVTKRLSDPVYNAIAATKEFNELIDEQDNWDSDGGRAVTTQELLDLSLAGLDVYAAMEALGDDAPGALTAFSAAVGVVGGDARAILEGLGFIFDTAGRIWAVELGNGLIVGLDGLGIDLAKETLRQLGIADGLIKNGYEVKSPSRKWAREIGAPLAQGIIMGFQGEMKPEAFGTIPRPGVGEGGAVGGVSVTVVSPRTSNLRSDLQRGLATARVVGAF